MDSDKYLLCFSSDTSSTKVSTFNLIFWQNPYNKESAEPRWKPDVQGRGGRSGRVNVAPRHVSHGENSFKPRLTLGLLGGILISLLLFNTFGLILLQLVVFVC